MAHRTRVKICGITRLEDALLSEALGVDALGFVFCEASKRFIQPVDAAGISNQLAPFILRVGLFLDAPADEVKSALAHMPDLIPQFHGRETADYCEQFGVPYLKAIGLTAPKQNTNDSGAAIMASAMPEASELAAFKNARGFLFDSNEPGALGGTGHVFDWNMLDRDVSSPVILAGGLNAENVRTAIEQVQPYAVDVSSGVEREKGIKDATALRQFVSAVNDADSAQEQKQE